MRNLKHIVVGNSLIAYDPDADAHYVLDISAREWRPLPAVPGQELSTVEWFGTPTNISAAVSEGIKNGDLLPTDSVGPEPDDKHGDRRVYTTDEDGKVVDITADPNKKKGKRYEYAEDFEDFWKRYRILCTMHPSSSGGMVPNSGNKKDAYTQWQALTDQEKTIAEGVVDDWLPARAEVPYAETYLKNKMWSDGAQPSTEPTLEDLEREMK